MLKALKIGLVTTLALAGCEEATGPVATQFLGTYQLESFRSPDAEAIDELLPYTSSIAGGVKVEVLNGSITLDEDFGFAMSRSWRLTYPDSVRNRQADLHGEYILRGNQIAFYGEDDERFGGLVTDTILTIVEPEQLINFRRTGSRAP